MVQTTDQDASRIRPLRGVLVMFHSADAERQTKRFAGEITYHGWPGNPLVTVENIADEKEV